MDWNESFVDEANQQSLPVVGDLSAPPDMTESTEESVEGVAQEAEHGKLRIMQYNRSDLLI
ncbi:MAG TPA: hypothetical protein VGV59_12275 [Pyrinomonadaceae bacterium]|nr:hypothetical protein [Pyrinomonadaceae bacterium]